MSAAALSIKPIRGASLRALVFTRDGGVCAMCGKDTVADKAAIDGLREASKGSRVTTEIYRSLLRRLNIKPGRPYWEADHTVPVAEGGSSDLSNLRTLCTYGSDEAGVCHKRVTAEFRARLKRKPSAARAQARKERREKKRARRG